MSDRKVKTPQKFASMFYTLIARGLATYNSSHEADFLMGGVAAVRSSPTRRFFPDVFL